MSKKCTIQISDEVTCRIQGLELSERKALMKKFEFSVPGARFLPSVRLGRWNGKTSFFSLGGASYVNLLIDIIPVIDTAGYEIELEDTRDYRTSFDFDIIDESTFSHKVWPKDHGAAGQPVVLRDYQIDICNKFLATPQCLQSISTAAGKTICTAALSYSVEKYGRSIIIVPNVNLVNQTEADYLNLGLDVGVYYGGRKDIGKQHTICTWQSLNVILKNTKEGTAEIPIDEFLQDVVCVIVDEVHSAKSAVLKELLTGIMSKIPIRWGLTGTIPKEEMDQMSLKISFGEVINYLGANELQDQGFLSKCHVKIIQLQDNLEHKEYQTELKYLLSDSKRLDVMAGIIDGLKSTGNTLVLVDRIEAGNEIISRIPDAIFVSGGTKATTRKEEYDKITAESGVVLVATYGVASVGINIVFLHNVVLVEPGKSFIRTIQSIGRGLRKGEGKDFVQIYDLTSNCKFSKRHLTSRKAFYKEVGYDFDITKLVYKP